MRLPVLCQHHSPHLGFISQAFRHYGPSPGLAGLLGAVCRRHLPGLELPASGFYDLPERIKRLTHFVPPPGKPPTPLSIKAAEHSTISGAERR
jgi:hypothetical protein